MSGIKSLLTAEEKTKRNIRLPKGRTIGWVILAVVIIVSLAAALVVPRLVDINKYHNQIQAQLEKRLGRKVAFTNMGFSLFPPSFQAENAMIAEDPRFKTGDAFATAEKLTVAVRFWPLLRSQIEIKSLELDRPRIELVKDAQGTWNFDTLGQKRKPAGSQKAASETLELDHLLITDGRVAVTNEQQHQPRAVYDHIDLDVTDFAPDQQFSLKVSALLPGAVKQAVLLEGKAGPIREDALKMPFDGRLHLDQVPTAALATFLNMQALNGSEALASGEARVKNSVRKLDSSGTIRLEDVHVHNVNVGYPITIDYDISDDTATGMIQIRHGDAKLGATPVTIAGWFDLRPSPSQMDLKLTAENASLEEAARLASAWGAAFAPGTDLTGQVNVNLEARGPANHPVYNGQLSARNLVVNNKENSQPLKVSAIDLTLTPDKIRSNDFVATGGATSLSGNFVFSQYSTADSSISASVRAPNARLEDIVGMARAAGIVAPDSITGEGGVSLDVHAEGPTKNLAALSFIGKGKLQNATLKAPALAKPVQVHHSDLTFNQNSTVFQNMSVTIGETSLKGSLALKDLSAPQVQFTLHADKLNVAEVQQLLASTPEEHARAVHDFWRLVPRAEAAASNEPSLINRMTGGGTLTAGAIEYDDLTLSNAHSTIALDQGVIRMNPVTADVYGGKESGSITIDMRPARPVYSVNLKTEKADANQLLSSVSSLKKTLHGSLTAKVNATFSSNSAEAIARSMTGEVELSLTNGKLMNLDLLHELAAVGKFVSPPSAKPENFTNLSQLSATFNVIDGVARTSSLKAAIDGGAIIASGQVNLAEQSLNLHVTAVLSKTLSQKVGGSQIAGLMNTALENSQNELVLPVILTGTFQTPQVAPDLQQIAQMKLQNLLPTTGNPNEFTSSVLAAPMASQAKSAEQQAGATSGAPKARNGKKRQQRRSPVVVSKVEKASPQPAPAPKK